MTISDQQAVLLPSTHDCRFSSYSVMFYLSLMKTEFMYNLCLNNTGYDDN